MHKQNMFFYLLLIFQIIHSISCDTNCHDCPIEANTFNYIVDSNRLPDQLKNCKTSPTDDICKIDIIWSRNPDQTQIALSGRDERMGDSEENLYTDVRLEHINDTFVWTRSISYTCATEKCNSYEVVKRILNSITLSDTLGDLQNLLQKDKDFKGTYCTFGGNTTEFECPKDVATDSCKQCSFEGIGKSNSIEICRTCLTNDIGETFIAHEVDFDLGDRTKRDHWMMECQLTSCNSIQNGDRIRQGTKAEFDFDKFLNTNNQSTSLSSISKILLICLGFFVKFIS